MCPPFWSTTQCKQRLHSRCCDQRSSVAVRSTPSDQRCQTSCCGRLVLAWLQMALYTRFKSGLLGHMSGSMKATFSHRRYTIVSRNARLHTVLVQIPLGRPLASYSFIKIKSVSCYFLLYVVYMPKIIKFYTCIQLSHAKMKVDPFNLAHPVRPA